MNYLLRFETGLEMPSQTIGNGHVPQDPGKDDDHRILYAKRVLDVIREMYFFLQSTSQICISNFTVLYITQATKHFYS